MWSFPGLASFNDFERFITVTPRFLAILDSPVQTKPAPKHLASHALSNQSDTAWLPAFCPNSEFAPGKVEVEGTLTKSAVISPRFSACLFSFSSVFFYLTSVNFIFREHIFCYTLKSKWMNHEISEKKREEWKLLSEWNMTKRFQECPELILVFPSCGLGCKKPKKF